MSKWTGLAKVRTNELAKIFLEISVDDSKDIKSVARAADLDSVEDGQAMMALPETKLQERGWTRRELRIATDAKMATKDAPYYLRVLADRTNITLRADTGQGPSKATTVIMPMQVVVSQEQRERAPILDLGDGSISK